MGVEACQVGVDDAGRGGLAVACGDDDGGVYTFDKDVCVAVVGPRAHCGMYATTITTCTPPRRTVSFCVKNYTILYARVAISRLFRRFRVQVATCRKRRSTTCGLISQNLESLSVACHQTFGKNGEWKETRCPW